MQLSESQTRELLLLARQSLTTAITNPQAKITRSSDLQLQQAAAVFVTLRKQQQLRGCIGQSRPVDPLDLAVQNMARSAAFDDPRFPPLNEAELADIHIHLSVLSELTPLQDLDALEMGRHGLFLESHPYHSLFLPEVAKEQGWTRQQMLTQLSYKAGLDENGWQQAHLFSFTTQSFGE